MLTRFTAALVAACALISPTLAQTYHGMIGDTPFMILTIPGPPAPVECCNISMPELPEAPPPPAPRYYEQQHYGNPNENMECVANC